MLRISGLICAGFFAVSPAAAQTEAVRGQVVPDAPDPASATADEGRKGCPAERPVFEVRASHDPVEMRKQKEDLKEALATAGMTVRLGPDVDLDFSDMPAEFFPLSFSVCVTLTSVAYFEDPVPPEPGPILLRETAGAAAPVDLPSARTPHSLGPVLRYGPHRDDATTFIEIHCFGPSDPLGEGAVGEADGARISGFRLFGPDFGSQTTREVGIRVVRCVDIDISNMEIAGWAEQGVKVVDGTESEPGGRMIYPAQIRVNDNYIHNNQQPSHGGFLGLGGHAGGYGVESGPGAWVQISRNVFDNNRHSIAAASDTGGYDARENLILRGGGYHGRWYNTYTHVVDAHGSGCWWSGDLCGNVGKQYWIMDNAFLYRKDTAIHIRGRPQLVAYIWQNVFPHSSVGDALKLNTTTNVNRKDNVANVNSFATYGVCDFDGDAIDDLFLPTGTTWWYSGNGEFPWHYLSTRTERLDQVRLGYFDADERCDVLTQSGREWVVSSGGIEWWRPIGAFGAPLEEVAFGRFDPNVRDHRPNMTRATTHAFRRRSDGQWFVTPLSHPGWLAVQSSSLAMDQLRFGDFTGDGVTDVLAVVGGRWSISDAARGQWQRLNPTLGDDVRRLYIGNMDEDDNIDDIFRLDAGINSGRLSLTWRRSKNGVEPWRDWRKYSFGFPNIAGSPTSEANLTSAGFVGRFGAARRGATLAIDPARRGHFFSTAEGQAGASPDWESLFQY